MRGQALGEGATVEAFALRLGQLGEGFRLGRVAEQLAGARRRAVDGEGVEPGFQHRHGGAAFLVFAAGDFPLVGDHRGHREAVAGQGNGWLQQVGEGQPAEARGQLGPGRGNARHGDRQPAMHRHLVVPGGFHLVDGNGRRRVAAGVQAVQLVLDPDQGEGVAADGAAGGFDHGQRGGGGDGGVNGVAAGTQHGDAGLGSQRLRGGDHAVAGEHALALGSVGVLVGREAQHGKLSSVQRSVLIRVHSRVITRWIFGGRSAET